MKLADFIFPASYFMKFKTKGLFARMLDFHWIAQGRGPSYAKASAGKAEGQKGRRI
jgi:hypothetical protein